MSTPLFLPLPLTQSWKVVANLSAPALVILAPLINFLTYHNYDYLTAEVAWVLLGFVVFGLALGACMMFAGNVIRVLALSVLLSLYFELHVDIGLKILLPVCIVVIWILRDHIVEIVTAGFLTLIIATLIIPSAGTAATKEIRIPIATVNTDLPPIVHLILDEHIGVEGIPIQLEAGRTVRDQLKEFYTRNGFRLFGKAFAQYYDTHTSLANLFNGAAKDVGSSFYASAEEPYTLLENTYFRSLTDRGYKFRVYQSSYIDHCSTPNIAIETCVTYEHNSIKNIRNTPLSSDQKASLIFHSFLSTLSRYWWSHEIYGELWSTARGRGWVLPAWRTHSHRAAPIAVPPIVDRIRRDIAESAHGRVFFAHLMLPHSPYAYRGDCSLRSRVANWLFSTSTIAGTGAGNTSPGRLERYQRYLEQVQCTQRLVDKVLDSLRSVRAYDEAIIIVHGDHGSRIDRHHPIHANLEFLTQDDYIDGFSTLFAVKRPHAAPGYDLRQMRLQDLLADALELDPVPGPSRSVFLRTIRPSTEPMTQKPMPDIGGST